MTVFIPEASLLCDSSSFTFTLQNSCPEGLSIVYQRLKPISNEEWLLGDPRDELDNKRRFDLPVGLRPREGGSMDQRFMFSGMLACVGVCGC